MSKEIDKLTTYIMTVTQRQCIFENDNKLKSENPFKGKKEPSSFKVTPHRKCQSHYF